MNKLVTLTIIFMLLGCSTKTEYITKYEDVYIPVRVHIHRPNRPIVDNYNSIIEYLGDVLIYTLLLEETIDLNNKEVKLNEKD